jgi:hypothetical protein
MSLTTDLLKSIAQGIGIAPVGVTQVLPGQAVRFVLNTPDLTNLQVPVLTKGDFSLTWLVKNVRFDDALPAPLLPDPNSPGNFLSPADSLLGYLTGKSIKLDASGNPVLDTSGNPIPIPNVLGGKPIVGVQVPVPGPSLKGAILPTNLTPVPVAASPVSLPDMPPLAPNTPNTQDVLSGVPGLLGQIGGSIPVLMTAPVTINVAWKVQVKSGLQKKGFAPVFKDLTPDKDFLAPNGLVGTAVDLIFAPMLKEYDGTDTSTTIFISATLTLSAGGESLPPITLPPSDTPLTLTLPYIGIPRVAAMFRNAGFAAQDGYDWDGGTKWGFLLIMVPSSYSSYSIINSRIDSLAKLLSVFEDLQGKLSALDSSVSTLNSVVQVLGYLTGLKKLTDSVTNLEPVQNGIILYPADEVDNLHDIVFNSLGGDDDTPANDEISSIIFLGLSGSKFELFDDVGCIEGHKEIVLTTGDEMWAALSSFSFQGQPAPPGNDKSQTDANQYVLPPSSATVSVYVTGTAGDTWNDTTSSVKFGVQ